MILNAYRCLKTVLCCFFCLSILTFYLLSCTSLTDKNELRGSKSIINGGNIDPEVVDIVQPDNKTPDNKNRENQESSLVTPSIDIPECSSITYAVYAKKTSNNISWYLPVVVLPAIYSKKVSKNQNNQQKKNANEKSITDPKTNKLKNKIKDIQQKNEGKIVYPDKNDDTINPSMNKSKNTEKQKGVTDKEFFGTESLKEKKQENEKNKGAREVRSIKGDDIEISFNKDNWIFLGFDKPSDPKGLEFLSRKSGNGETVFYFKAIENGIYDLSFERQNNTTSETSKEYVRIIVGADIGGVLSSDDKTQAALQDKTADELYGEGRFKEALQKYQNGYEEGSPALDDRIAELLKKTGNSEQAIKFWQKNISDPGVFSNKAVLEIAQTYMEKKDKQSLLKFVNQLSNNSDIPSDKYVSVICHYLESKGEVDLGLKIVNDYLAHHRNGSGLDRLYYILGQLYEKDTPSRDLKKSKTYYQVVCDQFPESFLMEAALGRINYLNRYFFIIK
jgi:hypothetical protein